MKENDPSAKIAESNERALSTLARSITLSEGQFALILVRSNYQICQQQMWERLQQITPIPLKKLVLEPSITSLYATLGTVVTPEPISALIVLGLELVKATDQILIATNQVRDEFPKRFKFPLVLWLTDEVLHKLARFAPDFRSWAVTSIKFELTTDQLMGLWQQATEQLFTRILSQDNGQFIPNDALDLAPGGCQRQELESALRDLQSRGIRLTPEYNATWQFILGRDAFSQDELESAIEQYQQSLQFWRQPGHPSSSETIEQMWLERREPLDQPPSPLCLERFALLLYHLGGCYCRQAQLQPNHKYTNWERARECFSESIEAFKASGQLKWVTQLTIELGEVLQNLQSWTELEALALRSLAQPQHLNHSVEIPQAYGFLAAVALHHARWEDAKVLAETALELSNRTSSVKSQHQGWYHLITAKAQRHLKDNTGAIASLEEALNIDGLLPTYPDQNPQLYIDILTELRSLYQEQKHYLRAFELKQKQRLIEQQYGFLTFLGAAPLQHFTRQGKRLSPLEIAAAGRLPDVNCLLERLSRNDHKLTIIHGTSGVGKSSLINAGLVPALASRTISAREVIPIVQTFYKDWINELAKQLDQALSVSHDSQGLLNRFCLNEPKEKPFIPLEDSSYKLSRILKQLRLTSEQNSLTVLIFDQFEEFFFVCADLEQRCQFYDFLDRCLNLPFVKVILSLREDYLHYLLECERYSNFNSINNNILDRQLRYRLGDLTESDAKNVISTLVAGSQFQLELLLIEALIKDLASPSGKIRLIELQVVGAQLQAEKIITLAQYQALGAEPKKTLVERWLLGAVADCGRENEETVWTILFALTDPQGTRPLKTKTELARVPKPIFNSQNQDDTLTQLNLILTILVGSGLLFHILDEPEDQYQIVHDYLVAPIRQQYKQRTQFNMVQTLKKSEIALLRVRKQRLGAILVGALMAILAMTAGGLGWRAEVQRRLAAELALNDQLSALSASSEALFVSNNPFDAVLEGLRATKRLQQVETPEGINHPKWGVIQFLFSLFSIPSWSTPQIEPDTRLQVITALSQALYSVSERNRLEAHTDVVSDVRFSPDGQLIASASRDRTVRLWRPNGALVATLQGHRDSVTTVSFSPTGQLIASGSWDGTVRLWGHDGTLKRTLQGHRGRVYSLSFSPNGQWIASAGSEGIIRLWTVGGQLIRTFRADKGAVQSVSFSPNGQWIASAGEDRTIKLWTLKGKLHQTLIGHQGKVNSVTFSPDGKWIASASDDRTVKLWTTQGKLLKTLQGHEQWVFRVAFSGDGQLLASTSADHTVKLWNRNGTLLKTFKGHSDSVTGVSFSPLQTPNPSSAAHLFLASASYDKTIKLWDVQNQSPLILQGHRDRVRDIAFSPDNQLIATAGNDQTVKLWNRTGQLLHTLNGHTERVYSVSFSPDHQLIASASRDGTIRLWRRDGRLVQVLRGHQDWVLQVAFSPDSQRLASASRDGTVKLWTRQGKLIKTLVGHQGRVNSVSFSPDGQLLASASDDHTVKLWTAGGRLLKTLQGHRNWVLDVSFSPDSQFLVSASYDNTVKIWHRDGTLNRTLKGPTDSVARARLSPTGQILATTSWDNRVQLWRLDDTLITTWESNKGRITSVNWSPDGKALAVGTEENIGIIWNLDLDDLWQKSCDWIQNYLQNNPEVRPSDRTLCQPIDGGQ